MAMNANLLAEEMMTFIGGRRTKRRREIFRRLARAIVNHIQVNAVVTTTTSGVVNGLGSAPGVGRVS